MPSPLMRVAGCAEAMLLLPMIVRWATVSATPGSGSAGQASHIADPPWSAPPEYSVEYWDAALGNHRAQIRFAPQASSDKHASKVAGSFAYARLAWRLPGLHMEDHQLYLFTHEGVRVRNLLRISVSSEFAEILFEPAETLHATQVYYLYYLPYQRQACVTGPASACPSPYVPYHDTSVRRWRQEARLLLQAVNWQAQLQQGVLVGIQSRTERDSFYPMEVAATAAETARLVALQRPLLLWAEDRLHPVRMFHALPFRWVARGAAPRNEARFRGVALRREFYALQLAAFAPLAPLQLRASWGRLVGERSGARIEAERLRCVNQPNGSVAAAEGTYLPRGDVLPLWIGIDVPHDAVPDVYVGSVVVRDLISGFAEAVKLEIDVTSEVADQRGDSDPWRHSRLRWLDSDVGADEAGGAGEGQGGSSGGGRAEGRAAEAGVAGVGVVDVGAPYRGRVAWDAATRTLSMGGERSMRLSPLGLPASMRVGSIELLASRSQLRLMVGAHGDAARLTPLGAPAVTLEAGGAVRWEQQAEWARDGDSGCAGLRVSVRGRLDDGGLAQLSATLRAPPRTACKLHNIQLVHRLEADRVPLINGFGYKGARLPREVRFRWDELVEHRQRGLNCRVWLGGAAAGVQLNLQGIEQSRKAAATSCGNDESGVLQCSDLSGAQYNVALGSKAWFNDNRGTASIAFEPRARARSRGLEEEERDDATMPITADKGAEVPSRLVQAAGARNDGRSDGRPGGRQLAATGEGARGGEVVVLEVSTGEIGLYADSPLELQWRLMLTPVRGAGQPLVADFETRYFHMQRFTTVAAALAAAPKPWIILHQGNQLNPHINYPFLTLEPLKAYVREAHANGAKVKLYYTVRELSGAAAELWALASLRGEILIRSPQAEGHAWLREHLRDNYTAAWHEALADGEIDAAVVTPAFTSRWDNYWIEGILWLVRNLDIDGVYLDGAPYEFSIMRRLRKALAPLNKRDFKLDLHASCYGNPHLPYVELYPYLDSIWFGEQCNYAGYAPEQWLAEVSGVPFGLQGQILGNNRDQWQGLVFGMTCRIYPEPHTCNPRPLYAVFDDLGFKKPRMIGWWDAACPVRSPDERVRATLYLSTDRVFAVAVASWADEPLSLSLTFDLEALAALGFTPTASTAKLRAREISGFQPAGEWSLHQQFEIQPKGGGFNEGWFFELV